MTEQIDDNGTADDVSRKVSWIKMLYISHAASTWGERTWEFGAGLLLLFLHMDDHADMRVKNVLQPTAMLVLMEFLGCSIFGPIVGRWVDRRQAIDPLQSALVSLLVQNGSISVAAMTIRLAGKYSSPGESGHKARLISTYFVILMSTVARLASLASTIIVEKKWATALSHYADGTNAVSSSSSIDFYEQVRTIELEDTHIFAKDHHSENTSILLQQQVINSDDVDDVGIVGGGTLVAEVPAANENNVNTVVKYSSVLSRVSARLRTIDLLANLLAPIVIGALFEYMNPVDGAFIVGVFNLLALPVEVLCLIWVDQHFHDIILARFDESLFEIHDMGGLASRMTSFVGGWKIYFRQRMVKSFAALAALHFSVLSFGPLTAAWLVAEEIPSAHVGIAAGFGALSGILSTFVTPHVIQKFDPDKSSLYFIWFLWLCLLPGFWVFVRYHNIWVLILSIIFSRFGLWGFDLCISQLLQECVEPRNVVGEVNGAQGALENILGGLIAIATSLISGPDEFPVLIILSFVSITTALTLHSSRYFRSNFVK